MNENFDHQGVHFKTLSLDELRSPDFNLLSDQEYLEEEEAEAMAETMEQYMSKTRTDYGSGDLSENTFSGSDNEDANEHIEKVLEIVDLFHVPNITVDQLMLRFFPISLTRAASLWLRNKPTGSIKTWEDLKTKGRSTKTSDRLAAIQAQLNNLGREIKKMNEIYVAQVRCEQCKGPHYTKYCPQKEEGKTLEEAYYMQFDSGTDVEPLEQVQYDTDDNVFANDIQHFEQSESIINTCAVETGDSNVIPDSPDMCDNDIQDDQNDVKCDDERVALANLIANLKLDVDENKKIQKQLKKANATLTQELTECKSILAETSRTLGESNSIRDSCLVALQNKQTEFERYKAFNDRTVDYDKLERKLNETLGLLAQKEIDIKEGLKVKAYEISVVKEKHDELVKQSLLTKSHYEGLVKEKTKVITDLKLKEEKDIDKMISMENQLKFLNEIVYKRSQSIQTIHMLAPKCPTFNGRPTFANPMYLKKAQYEKPCLYAIPHDQSDPANRLVPDREETLTLEEESRSKLNKDLVKPFDYTKLNSLYEIFKPPTQHYEIQFAQANEIRKKMWRKSFVKTKPNIFKNIDFLPVSKSISKSRQAYNVMNNNINHLKEIVEQAWVKRLNNRIHLHNPTTQDMEILVKTCLMPLAFKTQNDSFAFVHELKQEMYADLKYVESLENEIDELESDKAEFSNMYDMLLQECVSKDVMCSYLQSSSDLDEITELQC
ncbi:hypothetical protein Tco_0308368 [Tanacetum coccineum]